MAKKILKVAGIVAAPFTGGASLALTGAAGMLGGKKKKAATPASTPTPVMPLADDEAVKRARRASIARQMSRGGRSSTILSSGSDALGGGYG